MNNKAFDIPRIIFYPDSKINVIGQCDACSPVVFAQPELLPSSSGYLVSPSLIQQAINTKHDAFLSPAHSIFSVLNTSALACLQHFSSPISLKTGEQHVFKETGWNKTTIRSTLEQMISLGLLVPEQHGSQAQVNSPIEEIPQKLAVWLHLSESCNLNCLYCYLQHKQAEMSIETGKAAIEATIRSAVAQGYREVKFKYAGGESLLRFDLVKDLHRYAQKLTEHHRLKLDGVVLTNGTLLTEKIVKEMQELGLRLSVSLDGVQKRSFCGKSSTFALQRVYPDGRDASSDAMRGIETALECGLIPDITITVSGRNVGQLPELLEWVLERDLPFSLNFYRENACSACHTDLRLEEEQFIQGMLAAYKVIEANLPRRSLLASLADMANFAAPHLRRCSVGHSYLVFDTEGRVSKCQMQMDRPVTDLHADDPLAVVRADQAGIQNISVEEKEECRECQWRYWCAGGCPLETYRMTGRYDVKSPHCNIYKALYPEVLRLEGLRLLRDAGETY